ncbi:hypothetical protein SteCoe_504 [Stentor coeruleus]|uniref:Uncharacterized protein n=1 Tax=Stentor coeruleus TaxID=5963 RepID=A0A1R2D406_9CILI|nr:hypothetical protein SteCoe_504 [Stentor coeruleus]
MDLDNIITYTKNTSKNYICPQVKIPNTLKSSTSQNKLSIETTLTNVLEKLYKQFEINLIDTMLKEQYNMIISYLSQESAVKFIQKILLDLTEKNSYLQTCMKSINAREDSLKVISEMNDFLSESQNWYKVYEIPLQCAEILHAHRFITLTVAENIEKWKASLLCEYDKIDYVFYYKGNNYLQKIKIDSIFCVYGELGKIFNFSKESDPFLLCPGENLKNCEIKIIGNNYFVKDGMISLPIPFGLLQKIAEMNEFINTGQIKQNPQMYFNDNIATIIHKKKSKRIHNARYESKLKPKERIDFQESISPHSSPRINKKKISRKEIRQLELHSYKVKNKVTVNDEIYNDYKENKRKTPNSIDRNQKKALRKDFLPTINQSYDRKSSDARITKLSTPTSLTFGKIHGKLLKKDDSQRKISNISAKATSESIKFTVKGKKSLSAHRGFKKKSEDEAFLVKNTEKTISKSKPLRMQASSLIKKDEKNEKSEKSEKNVENVKNEKIHMPEIEKSYQTKAQKEKNSRIEYLDYANRDINYIEDKKIENQIVSYENNTITIEDKDQYANPIAIKPIKKHKPEPFLYQESYADRKSSINSKNLILHVAIEGIARNLIEDIIIENNFQLLAEEEINEYLNTKENIKTRNSSENIKKMMQVLENNKIADLI